MAKVTKSPRLAAIGVAILSGLILNLPEIIIINIIIPPRSKLANEAVVTLLPIRVSKFEGVNFCSSINSVIHATNEAKKPTTID